jgi:DtxR family Mn-dependent transcriptional regulator
MREHHRHGHHHRVLELSDGAEEILEHLWITTQEQREAAGLGLTRRDDENVRMLEALGLVRREEANLVLSPEGLEEARGCIRRHRLAERLLSDILDGGDSQIHAASCKFEHGLHRGLEEKVCTILGHPRACPHGKPIPPGECCRRMETEAGRLIMTLAEMRSGESAVIAYLHSEDAADLRKLMAIGALPGTTITLKQRFPSYLIELGNSQFAVDEQMARQIHVRRAGG